MTAHLLTSGERDAISRWFRSGEGNAQIAGRISEMLSGRSGSVDVPGNVVAKYSADDKGLHVSHQLYAGFRTWEEVAAIYRTLWQQELDGFTHAPVQRDPVRLEGKPSYQVGDKVSFQYGDHDVSGTISHIGKHEVLIYTGPYAWSHQTVERDFFEDAVRHDERNAGLFSPEEPAPQVSESVTTQEAAPETATIIPA